MIKSMSVLVLVMFSYSSMRAQTQLDLNRNAALKYKDATDILDSIYQQIALEYADDVAFIDALQNAQEQWLLFRQAQLKMMYPDREPGWYGSIQPLCNYDYLTQLTHDRIADLRKWLTTVDEGDACLGSIRSADVTSEIEIEPMQDQDMLELFSTLVFLESLKANSQVLKIWSAKRFVLGESFIDLFVMISEAGEYPTGRLYKVINLMAPSLTDLKTDNKGTFCFMITHSGDQRLHAEVTLDHLKLTEK